MPASSTLWRLANATGALEFHLPAADGAVGDLRLLLNGLLIASSLEQRFDAVALILVVGLAHFVGTWDGEPVERAVAAKSRDIRRAEVSCSIHAGGLAAFDLRLRKRRGRLASHALLTHQTPYTSFAEMLPEF